MKTPAFTSLLSASFVLFLSLAPYVHAQESPPTVANEAAVVAPEAPPAPSQPAATDKSGLRRLDVVPPGDVVEEPAERQAPESDAKAPTENKIESLPAAPRSDERRNNSRRENRSHSRQHDGSARVAFWNDSKLPEGESADAVVSILGSSTSAGHVSDAVVSIFGSSTSSGEVGNGVVSIAGSSRVTGGHVGDVVVSVLGNTYVNAEVHGDVVAVLGNVELGPDAVVRGNIVCVGGSVIRDPGAVVHGKVDHVSIGGNFSGLEGLHAWIRQCLLWGRPLAFGPHLMWAWWIAIGFLALYILVAALFPKGVGKCIETLEQSPGASLLTAVLVLVLTPFAAVLLLITIVGTPALTLFLLLAGFFGKLVMIAWIGHRILKLFAGRAAVHPSMAVLVGGVVVLGLYTIPIVGFVSAKLLSWFGLGVVVYTIFVGLKRNRTIPPVVPSPLVVSPAAAESAGFGVVVEPMVPTTPADSPAAPEVTASPTPPLVAISAATLHRAGFWIRIAASVLDGLLVALAVKLLPNPIEPNYLLAYAGYCILLWGLKGTTIGGIVCNLKVVRLDDRRVDWPTALVRGLAGFLSFFAAGIGFIWVAFDDQRQSWHDKIAGTTIVHVPKGVSLL